MFWYQKLYLGLLFVTVYDLCIKLFILHWANVLTNCKNTKRNDAIFFFFLQFTDVFIDIINAILMTSQILWNGQNHPSLISWLIILKSDTITCNCILFFIVIYVIVLSVQRFFFCNFRNKCLGSNVHIYIFKMNKFFKY